jgi:hypothetical protein
MRVAAVRVLPKLVGDMAELRPLLFHQDSFVREAAVKLLPQLINTPAELTKDYWLKLSKPEEFQETRIRIGLPKNWQIPTGILPALLPLAIRLAALLIDFALLAPFVGVVLWLTGLLDYGLLVTGVSFVAAISNLVQIARYNRTIGLRLVGRGVFTDKIKEEFYFLGHFLPLLAFYLIMLNITAFFGLFLGDLKDPFGLVLGLIGIILALVDSLLLVSKPFCQMLHNKIAGTFLISYR